MIELGLDVCLRSPPEILRGQRFGLLANQASVDGRYRYSHRLLAERFPGQLAALFSPQHGFFSDRQDNMIESPHGREPRLGIPVYSLYSDTRCPTPAMLRGLEAFVIDLQDVGTRVYTLIWTALYCLEACAAAGIDVVVLDRPNPLAGRIVEGPLLDDECQSFLGLAPMPMRHGLTIGELLCWLKQQRAIPGRLEVVPMTGYSRDTWFDDLGRTWVPPSPNMPRLETVLVYPGQVLVEGTQLSEGRGTTTPFEICGAPYIEPDRLVDRLARVELPGVSLRPIQFEPTFHKHASRLCGGVFVHVIDRQAFRPFRTTLAILAAVRILWPDDFAWLPPPYEYETEKIPIDMLYGSARLRIELDNVTDLNDFWLDEFAAVDERAWESETAAVRLYR